MLGLLVSCSEKSEKLSSEKLQNPVASLILTAEDRTGWRILKGTISESNCHVTEEVVVHDL